MKSSQRLKPLQRINEHHEQKAATALGKHQQKLETNTKRLNDLNDYRIEYGRQFMSDGQQGISAARIQDYQKFMVNLDKAIQQQKLAIRQLQAEYELLKRQWMAAHNRSKSIDNVADRYLKEENYQEEKRTQKDLDERNNRNNFKSNQ